MDNEDSSIEIYSLWIKVRFLKLEYARMNIFKYKRFLVGWSESEKNGGSLN